jgi:hypothetical protein
MFKKEGQLVNLDCIQVKPNSFLILLEPIITERIVDITMLPVKSHGTRNDRINIFLQTVQIRSH